MRESERRALEGVSIQMSQENPPTPVTWVYIEGAPKSSHCVSPDYLSLWGRTVCRSTPTAISHQSYQNWPFFKTADYPPHKGRIFHLSKQILYITVESPIQGSKLTNELLAPEGRTIRRSWRRLTHSQDRPCFNLKVSGRQSMARGRTVRRSTFSTIQNLASFVRLRITVRHTRPDSLL